MPAPNAPERQVQESGRSIAMVNILISYSALQHRRSCFANAVDFLLSCFDELFSISMYFDINRRDMIYFIVNEYNSVFLRGLGIGACRSCKSFISLVVRVLHIFCFSFRIDLGKIFLQFGLSINLASSITGYVTHFESIILIVSFSCLSGSLVI